MTEGEPHEQARWLAELVLDRVLEDVRDDAHLAGYYESLLDPQRALFARPHNLARWEAAYTFCLAAARGRGPHRVLDLGCGVGTHSLALASVGLQVVGVDLSGEAIETAERRRDAWGSAGLSVEGVKFRLGSGVEVARSVHEAFDVVLLHESLAHVAERSQLWPALRGALRRAGALVIAESNARNPAVRLGNWRRKRAGELAIADPRYTHKELRSERALRAELDAAGFIVTGTRFLGFAPRRIWSWSKPLARSLDATVCRVPGLRQFAVSYTVTARRGE